MANTNTAEENLFIAERCLRRAARNQEDLGWDADYALNCLDDIQHLEEQAPTVSNRYMVEDCWQGYHAACVDMQTNSAWARRWQEIAAGYISAALAAGG